MKLYLLPTGGVFGSAMREILPADVHIQPCDKPQCEVQIGKEIYHATDGRLTLPMLASRTDKSAPSALTSASCFLHCQGSVPSSAALTTWRSVTSKPK